MNRLLIIAIVLFTFCFYGTEVQAQRRGGGGGRAGGGGFSGGGFSGGGNMGSAYNRSPSMSRAAPSPARSYSPQPMNRPATVRPSASQSLGRPAMPQTANRSNPLAGGTSNRVAAARPAPATGRAAFQSPGSFQQPSRGQLDSFLNGGSAGPTRSSMATPTNPIAGGNNAKPSNPIADGTKTFETARGGTVTVGGVSGSGTTQGGTNVGGAVGGIKVETAGGNTFGKASGALGASDGTNSAVAAGSRSGLKTAGGDVAVAGRGVRAATDGTNSAIRAGSAVGVKDAAGNKAVNVRGGYADSSGYRQGGSVTARQNQWGYTSVNARGGYGNGNGTGQAFSRTAVRGPYGNVISGGRGASFINGQFVGGSAFTAVNGNFTNWAYFGPGYYGRYPRAWYPSAWAIVGTAWATATWTTAGSYCGCEGAGTYYDYEENVTYVDGNVLYEGEPVATQEEYYAEAEQIADAGTETENEDWLPLGVFAVIAEAGQTKADKVVQLALNKEGAVRGNYQDLLTDQVTPVVGAVDQESQRVALRLEGVDSLVVELGLYNLTNDEVPALLHKSAEEQQPITLIRLQNPDEESQP